MLNGIVLPTAPQSSDNTMVYASEMIAALCGGTGAPRDVSAMEEQAREQEVHQRFGECLHG